MALPSPTPIATDDVPWTEWSDVPRFGIRYKHLSLAALGEDYRIGIAIEELFAGKQSSPAHYHMLEEEHLFILEGALTVRIGDRSYPMRAGDYVCFPAGQRAGHCLINDSGATCRYVIIGEQKRDDVIVYTDSDKVLARSLGRRALFDLSATRRYWDGEDTGLAQGATPGDMETYVPVPAAEPKPPIASGDVEWNDEGNGGDRFGGQSRHLTFAAVGGDYHVGVLIEAPAPGKRLAPRHYHMLEEEHALILEGEVTLLLGDRQHRMKAGDYVAFPAGLKVGHSFLNSGAGPCRYLMIGERNPADVCVYPDSGKVFVRALNSEDSIFDMKATRRYWDGET